GPTLRRVPPGRSEGGPPGDRHVRGVRVAAGGEPDRHQRGPGPGRRRAHAGEQHSDPPGGLPAGCRDGVSGSMAVVQTETIDPKAVRPLRTRFRGALVRPGEEGYDEARRVWNGAIDRRPALIARCAGADDVVEAVRFA